MTQHYLALLVLLSPAFFVITAIVSWFQPGIRPSEVKKAATVATYISLAIAAFCGFFVSKYGLLQSDLIGLSELGVSVRLDSLSGIMLAMIALISFVVLRFSMNYLDGDGKHGAFIGRLAATIAAVQLLVLSGNLAMLFVSWVLTSISLNRLLVFYKTRPGAIIAARKKFIVARIGDTCLLAAFTLLYFQFGTGDLEKIFIDTKVLLESGEANWVLEAVALLLVSAALLKSAQFPFHGWLIEVMETPTPVSALLHAGLLNAGPFLIVRMAYIMEASVYAPILLLVLGGFTALFASIVYMTQTSIKTALGYSSVAHMGFSLMVCGLGLYPAAMLHLVAHSFYKAHAFLSSGSVIEVIRASKVTASKRIGSPVRILIGIALALGLYCCLVIIWGIDPERELALLAVGAILVMGLSKLFSTAIDSDGSFKLILWASLLSILVALSFFTLESLFHVLLSSQLPELQSLTFPETILIAIILVAFAASVFLQLLTPVLSVSTAYRALAIHLRNGLYVNTLFDRLVRAPYLQSSDRRRISVAPTRKRKLVHDERFANQSS